MMRKALILYGTRYGAAASTSEMITSTLQQEGIEVRIVNAKREKVQDIAEYDLVIVGSGIQLNRWTHEPENFLHKFQKKLANKKVALFVCCGSAAGKLAPMRPSAPPPDNWLVNRMPWARFANEDPTVRAKRDYLEGKAAKYNLNPIAFGLFGGIYNYGKMPWYFKKAAERDKARVQAAYKETESGVYDTRDLNAIRTWARQLADM